MREKFYVVIIAVLTALSVFLFLTNRHDDEHWQKPGMQCEAMGPGMHGGGMGMGRGMGMGMGRQTQAVRDTLFGLIKSGSTDTLLIFSKLEGVIEVQRENQKAAIRRILFMRDSLPGEQREIFLKQIDERFCQGQGMRGRGRGPK